MRDSRPAPPGRGHAVNYSTMLLGAAVSAIVAALAGTLSAPPRRQPPLLATMA
ncbi:MAG: hypothetical protein ACR2JO_02785 [Mycobacteriales bacterium]